MISSENRILFGLRNHRDHGEVLPNCERGVQEGRREGQEEAQGSHRREKLCPYHAPPCVCFLDSFSVSAYILVCMLCFEIDGMSGFRCRWHSAGTYDVKTKTGGPFGTMKHPSELAHGANNGLDIALRLLEPIKEQFPILTYADFYQVL